MKSIRILSLALGLSIASVQVSCSKDESKETSGEQNQYVDNLYAVIKTVERDLSQGYLLRNASDRERQSFSDILYDIKISTQRLKKNPNDAQALSSLYLASQSYNTLSILEVDGSQLGELKARLFETIDVLARIQGKTLDNIERILFEKQFTYDLLPFQAITDVGAKGWIKNNHEEISYAYVSGSRTSSWMFTQTLDLTNVKNPGFQVTQAISNRGNPYDGTVFFLVSENYTGGDPAQATWEVIPVERLPDGSGFTVVESEVVSLKRFEGKKIVMAFRYDTRTAANYPIWQINDFKFIGSGTLATAPLTLTGATSGGTVGGGSSGPTAISCAGAGAQNLFSYQFGAAVGDNFTVVDPVKAFTATPAGYPNVARLSGYNADTKGNNVGTTWVVSKTINLSATKDACVAVGEDIYLGKGAAADDLSKVQVLISTDYAGDVNKATWKPVPLKNRKAQTGLINKTAFAAATAAVSVKSIIGDGAAKVTVAFKYVIDNADSAASPAPWWGIGELVVAAVPTGTGPVVPTTTTATNTPAAPAAVDPVNPFALYQVANSTYESNCYRFSATGDYSKKFWNFTADSMSSLLLKYTDAACTAIAVSTPEKPRTWSTWNIGTLTVTGLTGNWAVVDGTCTSGCTATVRTAMRMSQGKLNEGSKIGTAQPEAFNTAEGKYVVFTKVATPVNLDELAAKLTALSAAPATAAPAPAETPAPAAPAPVTPEVPASDGPAAPAA
jgi:hypothetical protein